jgi:tetratricopeptide (TPR) repeat protein
VIVVAGWRLWRTPAVAPPFVDLAGADPEVAALVELARKDVLADPRSAAAWGHLGMVLRAHGFADDSSFCFAQAERLDPREPRWPYYRGLTLSLTNPEESIRCLRRALERLQDGPLAPRFRLAEVLLQQGELDETDQLLQQALERDPDSVRGRLLKARLLQAREDWKGALAALDGCLDDVHSRRQANQLAAEGWQRLGDSDRAEKFLAQASRLPPDVAWSDPLVDEVNRLMVGVRARVGLALQLEQQGQADEAIGLLRQLLDDHPRAVTAVLTLGQILRRQGHLDAAEQAQTRAVEIDRSNVEGWVNLGVVRMLRGKPREASVAFRQAIRLKPDHTLAHYNLGLCLQQTGDRDGARREFEAALRCQPDHALSRKALAELEREAK